MENLSNYLDLSDTNPLHASLPYPEGISGILKTSPSYDPDPQGLLTAREAVSAEFTRQGLEIAPGDILLTSGTSEAYSLIFKVLSNPGDRIGYPVPGYPLLEHLVASEGLEPYPYLLSSDNWGLDRNDFPGDGNCSAWVAISPHNPTGTFLTPEDRRFFAETSAVNGAALVMDEVFVDYAWENRPVRPENASPCLTFHLGGLSKSCGLPQLKCSWIGVRGPESEKNEAVQRLSFLADQYLSVGMPVQQALPSILGGVGPDIRKMILSRIQSNRQAILEYLAPYAGKIRSCASQGGWNLLLKVQIPSRNDEETALELLKQGVWMMPGSLFDFEEPGYWVVSLLTETAKLSMGLLKALPLLAG